MMGVKTVCVIGAGPSGLVAAKTLTHDHPKDTFKVTILEQSNRIGGLWPVSKVDNGLVNPDMCTNQSRHTVNFSDLAWPETYPQFPKAWQVGEYLQRYMTTYPGYEVRTSCKVLKTDLDGGKWKVHFEDRQSAVPIPQVLEFDHLIIASGFFGQPKTPKILEGIQAPVCHSSHFRDTKTLLGTDPRAGRRILVVGGQFSGVETAASIASQLSSATHSVDKFVIPHISEYSVTHIIQKPFWVLPLVIPSNPKVETVSSGTKEMKNNFAPNFLPVDLISYKLAVKPAGPLNNSSGHITAEAAGKTHGFMKSVLGGDQSDLGLPELAMTKEVISDPPYLGISDQYYEYVRSGKIKIVRGKVTKPSKNSSVSLCVQDGDKEQSVDDIAAVVFATGFDPSSSLDFLPKHILGELHFDPKSESVPLALNVHGTISKKIPSLGFVGFYRSPYWGVMEKQAEFLGKFWTGNAKAAEAVANDDTLEKILKLRKDPRIAQFPMGDYPYLMEDFSEILGIKRIEPEGVAEGSRSGIVLSSRYLHNDATEVQVQQSAAAILDAEKTLKASVENARFVPWAIFRAMQGDWRLEREIISRRSDYPSGNLSGLAFFHPRAPTDDSYDSEYLYQENGEFVSSQGFRFTATRSYAYRYNESTDTLSAWFVKPKDNKTVDNLFHQLEIIVPEKDSNTTGNQPWRAKSAHLCIKDMYNVKYEFMLQGVALQGWTQEYTVNGPAKDYTIKNVYRRPDTTK